MTARCGTGRSEECRIGICCRHFPTCRTRVIDGLLVADVVRTAPEIAPLLIVQNGFCLEVAFSGEPTVLRIDSIVVAAEHPLVRIFHRLVHGLLERIAGTEFSMEHPGVLGPVGREDLVPIDFIFIQGGVSRVAPAFLYIRSRFIFRCCRERILTAPLIVVADGSGCLHIVRDILCRKSEHGSEVAVHDRITAGLPGSRIGIPAFHGPDVPAPDDFAGLIQRSDHCIAVHKSLRCLEIDEAVNFVIHHASDRDRTCIDKSALAFRDAVPQKFC